MTNKFKDVTSEYALAQNKQFRVATIFDCILAVFVLMCCFLPVAKIGKYSIGNTFQILINYLKQINSSTQTSSSYLLYFAIFCGAMIFFVSITFIGAIEGLFRIKQYDKMQGAKVVIDEKDEGFVISSKYIIRKTILFVVLFFIAYCLIVINDSMLKSYSFTSDWNYNIGIIFIVLFIKNINCSLITLKYDEKGRFNEEYLLDVANMQMGKSSKKRKHKKTLTLKDMISWGANYKRHPVLAQLIMGAILVLLGFSVFYNVMFAGYAMLPIRLAGFVAPAPKIFENVFPESVTDKTLMFDVKELKKQTRLVVKEFGSGDCVIELKYLNNGNYESNTKSFKFFGDSYDYAIVKIRELQKEILELQPKENTEEGLNEYIKQIKLMTETVKVLEKNVNSGVYPYEYINFVDGYMVDVQYNATGKNDVKWGVKEDGLKGLIFKEKITLTDKYCKNEKAMDRFAVGTDFSQELIVARVQYTDGSVRISKIKPTNAEELNNATAGKHTIKWSDSWGEYQTMITLYNK